MNRSIKQYGVIPYLRKKGELRVVLVTSASGYWIFPKGNFEKELGKRGTAELEAFEEAGVRGIFSPRRSYRAKIPIREGQSARLLLYPLSVEKTKDAWPESSRRQRKIIAVSEARKLIESKPLLKCLEKFERDMLG